MALVHAVESVHDRGDAHAVCEFRVTKPAVHCGDVQALVEACCTGRYRTYGSHVAERPSVSDGQNTRHRQLQGARVVVVQHHQHRADVEARWFGWNIYPATPSGACLGAISSDGANTPGDPASRAMTKFRSGSWWITHPVEANGYTTPSLTIRSPVARKSKRQFTEFGAAVP